MFDFFRWLFGRQPAPAAGQRQFQEHFDQLVADVRDYAIFLLDAQGHVASWNAGAERIKGYAAAEIIGQHFSRFYPPQAVASGWPAHELAVAAQTGRFEDEGWRIRKDGTQFWANVVITALRDEPGGVRGFLKITRDLTGRRAAEENARKLIEEQAGRRAADASAAEAERAQRDERRQREQLHVTLNSIGDAVIVTDRSGAVTFLNPVAQRLIGWPTAEAVGQPLDEVFRIVNEDTRQPVENPVTKVLREGVIVGMANHTVLLARDGREIPIDDSGAPIRDDAGTIAGVVLVFRDVSEARRAVHARLHLAAIVESSDDAIISKSLEGIIESWNKGAERLYGYTADEVIGQPLSILVPPNQPDELPGLMERIKRGEQVEHFETARIRKDGSRVEVSLTISPVRNSYGKVVGASKIARDITEVKRNQARLRFLADASRLLTDLLDVDSTLRRVAGLAVPQFADWCTVDMFGANNRLERVAVSHVDPANVQLGHELFRRHPPDLAATSGIANVLRTGQPELAADVTDAVLADRFRDPKARRMVAELGMKSCINVPLTARGKLLGVMTFGIAVSERRFGPADLQLAVELAQRASASIENARLYGDLKEADRQKNEFLAMLAHELRNPLAPVRNALQIMKTPGPAGEKAREMAERQVRHIVRLVDDLMDVSRIIRGGIDLHREPVQLGGIITQAVEISQPIIDAQGQELLVEQPPEPIWLDADPARLTQVVSNLLHNAAKFSQRAGRIWLSAAREHGRAVIRVRDEGSGIQPEKISQIFDLFVQGDRSLERAQGGLGIGLTVVRRLVEMHGGRVSARSEGAGKGSEFEVSVPCLAQAPRDGVGPLASAADTQKLPPRRVLVVDDNVDAAESTSMLLRLWGHDVQLAYNGQEALRAADEFHPEVILLDIGLPGMSGYDVARQLRQKSTFEKTLLVAVTGYGQDEDRRRSHEAGFDVHLVKPADAQQLRQLLGRPANDGKV
ncbi:MAG: PAS domain S-box protein [Gemmataceae bacterium]